MATFRHLLSLGVALLSACGTYYDPADAYVRGVRFYDRGAYVKAKEIWEPLVSAGDCDAEFRLGLLYFGGQGVDRDVPRAISLWTSAANRGQPRAQYSLADVYFHNEEGTMFVCRVGCDNVPKDLTSAYKWYLLAEKSVSYDNDKKYMAHILPLIREKLSPEERRLGEEAAAKWTATPSACKPRVLL
jgi:hypothetical protein